MSCIILAYLFAYRKAVKFTYSMLSKIHKRMIPDFLEWKL